MPPALLPALIRRSARKGYSQKSDFRFTEFPEVRQRYVIWVMCPTQLDIYASLACV